MYIVASSNRRHKPKFRILNPYGYPFKFVLKGQMHCHSTNSPDAEFTPLNVCQQYEAAGFDFITLTDHNYITSDPGGHGLIWLCDSYENTASGVNPATHQHIVVYDTDAMIMGNGAIWNKSNVPVEDVLDFHVTQRSEITSLAHPNYSTNYYPNTSLEAVSNRFGFVEVWNAHAQNDLATAARAWDILLSRGFKVYGLSGDDYHNDHTPFAGGWVEVFSNTQDKAGILASLQAGNFIASNGINSVNSIQINNISLSGKTISIQINESATIRFIGINGTVLKEVSGINASYNVIGSELYVRVEIIKGIEAKWLQPFFIE